MTNKELVYIITSYIPFGKVATYGQIARLVNLKSARVVGNILHNNREPDRIPCHRVVNKEGHLAAAYAYGGDMAQKRKLQQEGIVIEENRVLLVKYCWKPHRLLKQYFSMLREQQK